jgi:hypothetical protein
VKGVVVSVPVLVRTFAKRSDVFFFAPRIHPEFVGCVEFFDSGNINHFLWFCGLEWFDGCMFPASHLFPSHRIPQKKGAKLR